MLKETEMLNFIRQNVQMGIDGIKLVIDDTDDKDFYTELDRQLTEYKEIYKTADELLQSLGGEKENVAAAVKIASHLSARMKTMNGSTSKIAESMIQGSTMGITKIIKHKNEYNGDSRVLEIADKLLKTEENNVEQLKKFL